MSTTGENLGEVVWYNVKYTHKLLLNCQGKKIAFNHRKICLSALESNYQIYHH